MYDNLQRTCTNVVFVVCLLSLHLSEATERIGTGMGWSVKPWAYPHSTYPEDPSGSSFATTRKSSMCSIDL